MRKPSFLAALRAEYETELAARRSAHPHEVRQRGMLRSIMGDEAFFAARAERHQWIAKQGYNAFFFDELFDADGSEAGRSYRFADQDEAFHFRMRF